MLLNDHMGPLLIEVPDPIGINDVVVNYKRSDKYEGITFDIVLDFDFLEQARVYIGRGFDYYGGPDCQIVVNVYEYEPNTYDWEFFSGGQIAFNKYDMAEDRVTVNIEQTGFQRNTLNLIDTDVNLETTTSINGNPLPVNTGVKTDILYHSKAILKGYDATPTDDTEFQQVDVMGEGYPTCITPGGCVRGFDVTAYGQVDLGDAILNEFGEGSIFNLPYGYSVDGVFPFYQARESGVIPEFIVRFRLKHTVTALLTGGDIDFCGSGSQNIPNKEVKAWFRHTDSEDNIITEEEFGVWTSNVGCGNTGAIGDFETKEYSDTEVPVSIGDKMYVFFTWRLFGNYEQNFGGSSGRVDYTFKVQADPDNTFVRFNQKTVFEDSTVKTCMIYEAVERCAQFYTNQVNCFRSSLLGRTDIMGPDGNPLYDVDGDYALIGITNGNNLRGRDKPIIATLQDLLDFIDSVACIGFGFETAETGQILRLEYRDYFYKKNVKILTLREVADVHLKIDTKRLYNQIEYGYSSKLDIGTVNAIDEICTLRRQIIPIINTKNKLQVATTMRVSGYQFEFQRRLIASTAESKLDDENFCAVMIRDGLTFRTKKDEGYAEITGVFDPGSGYNYDISPARNYRNWFKVVGSSLIRSFDKVTKFSYGEVNYTATTRKVSESVAVAENGNIDLSDIEPIMDYMAYSFVHPITRYEFGLIRANPFGYIEFTDLFGEVGGGFISPKGIEYNKEEGTAEFDLIRVFRKP